MPELFAPSLQERITGHLLFSCGCLIRACIMARAVLALLYSEYPRCERPKQKGLRKAGFLNTGCGTGHRSTTTGTGMQF